MAEYGFASTTVKIGAVAVAKVTGLRLQMNMQEIEVTGAEDVSGALVNEIWLPVAIGRTLDLDGIAVAGDGLTGTPQYEAGQELLRDAAETGGSITLEVRKDDPNVGGVNKGYDYVGYFTSFSEQGGVKDVYKWSGTFRINSQTEVLT